MPGDVCLQSCVTRDNVRLVEVPFRRGCVVWRDVEKVDNAALNKLLDKLGVNPSNTEFDVVYVNGDHAVANMTLDGNDDGKVLKVRQIENEFMDRMFEDA